jgi:hypothetical protein
MLQIRVNLYPPYSHVDVMADQVGGLDPIELHLC